MSLIDAAKKTIKVFKGNYLKSNMSLFLQWSYYLHKPQYYKFLSASDSF